ncbi:hypothetical protein WICMUC_002328 [Wickerhamomyces mucosus]|uniref:mRNA stability protein n=1 Tax=Wickerhamomyces mucosus TaxID=1378264 RepID=A0A9P8PR18_9ASCO|nr:hypothetical protein WICMUC_002328 [Wickerhamomyces mucosus]
MSSKQQVDESKLSPQELRLFKLYGKLPSKNEVLSHKLQERKYFDSGDYAMNQAGFKDQLQADVSNKHLNPEHVSRINRNSISGASATGNISNLRRSSLENEITQNNNEKPK